MKKAFIPLALATALFTTGCKDSDSIVDYKEPSIPNSAKEMISFSLSDGASSTRAGFTGAATALAIRIQSDEKGGSGKKYTRTVAEASKDATNTSVSYSTVTFGESYKRYWDDAHGRKSLLSVFAVAVPNGGSSITNNGKSLETLLAKGDDSKDWGTNDDNTIEWIVTTSEQKKDAATVTTPTENIDKEDLVYSNNIQANTTLGKDGIYRWNYSATTPDYDPAVTGDATHHNGQMLFFQSGMTDSDAASKNITEDPGHFDKGHMKFNHALSRISIKLVAGEGFTKAASGSFVLSNDGVQFLNMNVKGKLDLPTGKWTLDSSPTGTIVTKPTRKTTDNGATPTPAITSMYYETVAQMLPDYIFNSTGTSATTNVIKFNIDGNDYFIPQASIYKALNDNASNNGLDATATSYTMAQGKNYSLTITINKKQIEALTATLKAWDDVEASMSLDNSHINVTTSTIGSEHNDFNLFRLEQALDKIYTDDNYSANVYSGNYKANGVASLTEMKDANGNSYSPKCWSAVGEGWYYKDNQTAYHLRTLNNLAADEGGTNVDNNAENVNNTTDPAKSYFNMKNGAQANQDYHWGAPMTTNADLKYNTTTGYTNSIHKGFVAPKNNATSPINITELHMMSNINIVLKTTTDDKKIALRTGSEGSYQYATVKITNLLSEAEVDMGTGLVTPKTIATDQTMTKPATYFVQSGTPASDDITTTQSFTWAVVPQALKVTTGTGDDATTRMVGITITTPDNNEYYIIADLSTIVPTSLGNQAGQMHNTTDPITQWYPNHSYTYTFTITKKGIDAITCTLADWATVTAADTPIDLEK